MIKIKQLLVFFFLPTSEEYFRSCLFVYIKNLENSVLCRGTASPKQPGKCTTVWSLLFECAQQRRGANKRRVHTGFTLKLSQQLVRLRILQHLSSITLEQEGHRDRCSSCCAVWLTIYLFCLCQVSFSNCVRYKLEIAGVFWRKT